MQDPYFAVKEEVEHSVSVVQQLHERWRELLASGKKSDEFEWTASELLSGLRSIEWDLQDLEDTVSIVEGNRQKFQLEEEDVQDRKTFIDTTRKQITALRDEVQGNPGSPGFSTKEAKRGPSLPSIGKKRGYGKVGGAEMEMMPAPEIDVEHGSTPETAPRPSSSADDIIGDETDGGAGASNGACSMHANLNELPPISPPKMRHRRKKCCIALTVLVTLVVVTIALIVASGHSRGETAKESLSEAEEAAEAKLSQIIHGDTGLTTNVA